MSDPILETRGLTKTFGALAAVDDVTLEIGGGQVHAVIGPNGAGKTTLINLLSGDLAPSSGAIRFKGRDIAGAPANRVARLGVGRVYQKTNIFPGFTCLEHCWLGALARRRPAVGFFGSAASDRGLDERARRVLAACGLDERADAVAATLSHGDQRRLEIAMMLATEPDLLLLDEPLAGMGAEESLSLTGLLRRLAGDHTLILVEHDMDAVFAVADVLTVMVNGRVLETGAPQSIRASAAVREAYLGGDRR